MAELPPFGVLLVGSVPLSTAQEVFKTVCAALPGRLQAIPDGETGERDNYIRWQLCCFPSDTIRYELGGLKPAGNSKPRYDKLGSVQPTKYDEVAISSYAQFRQLRESGDIPKNIRFQVSLPTPVNSIIGHIRPEFHEELEPLYEKRFHEALANITDSIPADDLVIQWDLCFDVIALEYENGAPLNDRFKAHFSPVMQGILDRLARLCSDIPPAVPLAFHLCYGDLRHKHFMEPADTSLLVRLANEIVKTLDGRHKIEWIHMPVPRDRNDLDYFEPLKALDLKGARLYLGLVHANDEDGAREKIRVAQSMYKGAFGVATECGMGRTPREELDSILAISKVVTEPRN